MMNHQKTIDALNTLVDINNIRIEGYESALKYTKEKDLFNLFTGLMNTSMKNKQGLIKEIMSKGGRTIENVNATGKFFKSWIVTKAALVGNNRKLILISCEFGEGQVLDIYKNVLKDGLDCLSMSQQSLIYEQRTLIKADHNKVRFMQDAFV